LAAAAMQQYSFFLILRRSSKPNGRKAADATSFIGSQHGQEVDVGIKPWLSSLNIGHATKQRALPTAPSSGRKTSFKKTPRRRRCLEKCSLLVSTHDLCDQGRQPWFHAHIHFLPVLRADDEMFCIGRFPPVRLR
jgi:hypothetical protein